MKAFAYLRTSSAANVGPRRIPTNANDARLKLLPRPTVTRSRTSFMMPRSRVLILSRPAAASWIALPR
jgi:hypothetical protein